MAAQALEHVLKACGDNLTRENVMKQAASLTDLELGGLLPGIKLNTSATNFAPISQLQLTSSRVPSFPLRDRGHGCSLAAVDGRIWDEIVSENRCFSL
jgi:hypothetical protein